MKIKQIARPDLKSATPLSALDMNQIHLDRKHTVLTPQVLEGVKDDSAENR